MSETPADLLEAALENPPFPWQARLLRDFLAGNMPDALDLPTGLGKTSVMAIWLVARACGAELPRRLVYVVDRRAVVDQATSEAEGLRAWARDPRVNRALGLGGRELAVSTLRGQYVDNREWLLDPSAPAIVVGTVDMVGSRLLFEGYGSSRKMRPFFAGLLGQDTLLIIDESHLVPPFERMVRAAFAIGPLRRAGLDAPPSRLLPLSATGGSYGDPFQLDADDHAHPIVAQRCNAPKNVHIECLRGDLAAALADRAWTLAAAASEPRRILVFTDRRKDADKTRAVLEKRIKAERGRGAGPTVVLFVGGRRVHERTLAMEELRASGFIAGSERPSEHVFVIATAAGEVGVDLDADDLVADVVAWERMVQRLGRVNRRGNGVAQVHLLYEPLADDEDDERMRIKEGARQLIERLERDDEGVLQASPAALARLREGFAEAVLAATTPNPLYPPLTRPLLDAWSMTSLAEHSGRPEVLPWLRGWIEQEPQTTLVWRVLLPPAGTSGTEIQGFFNAAAPHASERLEVSTWQVADWITKRLRRIDRADPNPFEGRLETPVMYRLDAAQKYVQSYTLSDLGDELKVSHKKRFLSSLTDHTLVLDADFGGLGPSGLLDDKENAPPPVVLPTDDQGRGPVLFRVVEREPSQSAAKGWFEIFRMPLKSVGDEVEVWLAVDKFRDAVTNENARAAGRPQHLVEHQAWTREEAEGICQRLGLSKTLTRVITTAARLHDEGKRAPRWQRAFHAPTDAPYAKTQGPLNVHDLGRYRHEFGSLPYVVADSAFQELAEDERELVLHLVAAHHGHARPTIVIQGCDDAPPSMLEQRARQVGLRFLALQEHWGPWGLAWLEALLRSADQRASRRNQEVS